MPKEIVTDKDTTLMNFDAVIFSKTTALLFPFNIARNVRVKCITDCKVKSKDVKMDGKDKVVKEVKSSELGDNILKS